METSGIVFLEQYVRAIPEFDDSANLRGTVIEHDFRIRKTDEELGQYAAFLSVFSDLEGSDNPPFEFRLECMMPVELNEEDLEENKFKIVKKMIFQMMFASTRERLASLSSRSPWNSFHLGPFPYDSIKESDEEE